MLDGILYVLYSFYRNSGRNSVQFYPLQECQLPFLWLKTEFWKEFLSLACLQCKNLEFQMEWWRIHGSHIGILYHSILQLKKVITYLNLLHNMSQLITSLPCMSEEVPVQWLQWVPLQWVVKIDWTIVIGQATWPNDLPTIDSSSILSKKCWYADMKPVIFGFSFSIVVLKYFPK